MDFNKRAQNWDTPERRERSQLIASEIEKNIQIQKHYNALEFGCGTGLISFNLKNKFNHITLVDTSTGMLQVLNDKIKDANIHNMTTILIEENTILQGKNKFNIIYTSMVLHHVKNLNNTLNKLFELLLHNGGCLCIVDLVEDDGSFHKNEKTFDGHNGFNINSLEQTLIKIGFKNIKSNIFYTSFKIVDDTKIPYSLFIMTGEK